MKTIETFLPVFNGFYGTLFESDSAEESELRDLDKTSYEVNFDYKEYMERVSIACVGAIQQYLLHDNIAVGIEFKELASPREYNFTNDTIWVELKISEDSFDYLMKYCFVDNAKEFQEFLTREYASRSGFVSFVEDDIKQWESEFLQEESKYFGKCFGGLLNFYFENEGYTDADLQNDVVQECSYIEVLDATDTID